MLTKLIFPDSFDLGMPAATLVPIHSRGVERQFLRKRAAMFDDFMDKFERRPGHSYIHLISVGAHDRYGSNNNGDAFNKEAELHACVEPARNAARVTMMDGGLSKYHDLCFEKNAGVYKHHQNRHKKGKPSGYIAKAAINSEMDRGELLIGVETALWERELQKLAEDKPVFFSMGCDTPADLCSYCHNRAHTRDEYCDHLRNEMLTITKEGHQICALTDTPYFHDISGVVKPAEKISFGLRKVASGQVVGSAELAAMYGLTPRIETVRHFLSKRAVDQEELLRKLADIEKELLMAPADAPEKALIDSFGPESGHEQCCAENLPAIKDKPCGEVLGALRKNAVVLPLSSFLGLIAGDAPEGLMPKLADVRSSLPGVFGRLLDDSGLAEFLGDSSYEPEPTRDRMLLAKAAGMAGTCSLDTEPTRMRIIRAVLRASPSEKRIIIVKEAASMDPRAELVAREYARYLLSFADGLDASKQRLTVAQMLANVP